MQRLADEASQAGKKTLPSLSRLLQLVIGGIVIFLAVGGGVYTGFSAAMKRAADRVDLAAYNDTYLDAGDRFPDYRLWDIRAEEETCISRIVSRGPCLLIFVSRGCGACSTMLSYWSKKVVADLKDDIQLVCVYDEESWSQPGVAVEFPELAAARVTTTDRSSQRDGDGIQSTPTVVALDHTGVIRFIVSGFSRKVTSRTINAHF